MQFTREIQRLLAGILLVFGVVAVSATYWAIVGPDTILRREDNPRRVESEASIVRGDIVDRDNNVLATSIQNANRTVTRRYFYPEMNSALGYYSLRYGVGGAEAAYNTLLRGDNIERNLSTYLSRDLLHNPQVGSAIRLTLDLDVQREIAQAMQGRTGAAVVMAVPGGDILAIVSLPTYDPNTLDAEWETLKTAPGNPFFNRVLQGNYQPGGMLQTPLLAEAILTNLLFDTPIENATRPVRVDDLEFGCAARPPDSALTLSDAYLYACPLPFAELGKSLGAARLQTMLDMFRIHQPPVLPGFVPQVTVPANPEVTPEVISEDTLMADVLGQGKSTTTPLAMVMMAAAILNNGNAPQPQTLLAIRPPYSSAWEPVDVRRPTIPMTTADVARQLGNLMRRAAASGAARNTSRVGLDIGGHAALAYTGEGAQAWFIGFVTLDEGHGIAVAIVLENTADPALAADLGGTALAAAHTALQNTP